MSGFWKGKTPTKSAPQHASAKSASKPREKPDFCYLGFLLIWVMLAMTLSQYLIGLPLQLILGDDFSQPFYTCLFYGLTYLLALALVVLVPPRFIAWAKTRAAKSSRRPRKSINSAAFANDLKTSRAELGLSDLPTVTDVLLAPIAYLVYLVLAQVFTNIMSSFAWFNPSEAQDTGFGYFITTSDRIVAMIALVFIAPIAEEIIMRGWLYGKLREKLKIPAAIILTSLVFSLLHGQWNVGVGVFALSIILCSLREITGTIWSGILLHMFSNGVAFYLLFVAF